MNGVVRRSAGEEQAIRRSVVLRIAVALLVALAIGIGVTATFTEVEAKGPCRCPLVYAPVQCDNGKVYPNPCEADCHNGKNCVSLPL